MDYNLKITDENVGEFFEGVMVPARDFGTTYYIPGWRCRACGWTCGTQDLPPSHDCPADGTEQFNTGGTMDCEER